MEEKKGYLKAVGAGKSFKLRTKKGVLAEVHDLEGLKAAIERAPAESILFHMDNNRNDFADWIGAVVSCSTLSEVVQKIEPNHSDLEHTRNQLLETLDLGIKIMKEIHRQ